MMERTILNLMMVSVNGELKLLKSKVEKMTMMNLIMTIVVQNVANHQKRNHQQVKKYAMEIV